MTTFEWTPWFFWVAAGLTLLPASLTLQWPDPKSATLTVLTSQCGTFFLMVSLGLHLPAIIFLMSAILINFSNLMGIIAAPDSNDEIRKPSLMFSSARIGIGIILFLLMVYAATKIVSTAPQQIAVLNKNSPSGSNDIMLLLIITGLFFLLIIIAINQFFKR